jgi:hypothetical protein
MGIKESWNSTPSQSGETANYWRIDPDSKWVRWHVAYHKAGTLGSNHGQILDSDGWYWWTANFEGIKFSSMFGPFSSDVAAAADCEVTHAQNNLTQARLEARKGRG